MLDTDILSAIIICKNEGDKINGCIASLLWCDEIIIVDDFSNDLTLDKVKEFNSKKIKIYKRKLNDDFSSQRNFALTVARKEWVLFVDADETVSEPLRNEISSIISDRSGANIAFNIQRVDQIFGKILHHGETGDINFVRLAKRGSGQWQGKIHEKWIIKGKIGTLRNVLLHTPHRNVANFLKDINYYTSIRAKELLENGKKTNLLQIVLFPIAKFIKNYFLKLGLLDGIPGLISAIIMSFHSFLVRGKLWSFQNKKKV
jgi:glycosyltransferase involved in cell wall biosynthesis